MTEPRAKERKSKQGKDYYSLGHDDHQPKSGTRNYHLCGPGVEREQAAFFGGSKVELPRNKQRVSQHRKPLNNYTCAPKIPCSHHTYAVLIVNSYKNRREHWKLDTSSVALTAEKSGKAKTDETRPKIAVRARGSSKGFTAKPGQKGETHSLHPLKERRERKISA
jgi:hypothetical protein